MHCLRAASLHCIHQATSRGEITCQENIAERREEIVQVTGKPNEREDCIALPNMLIRGMNTKLEEMKMWSSKYQTKANSSLALLMLLTLCLGKINNKIGQIKKPEKDSRKYEK